jgi:hypothetical protein
VNEGVSSVAGWSDRGSYTPTQAAHILRLTPTRVRQLLQSGELEGERDDAGHWSIPARVVHTRLEHLRRESLLEAVGYDPSSVREMVEELRDRVAFLERSLERRSVEAERYQQIVAGLTQTNNQLATRLRELDPPAVQTSPQEPSGTSESAGEEPEGAKPRSAAGGSQDATERAPWWRRIFG